MSLLVSDHARERFAERVWPTIQPGTVISKTSSIDNHIRDIYANGKSIPAPFPIELHHWTKWIKLGDGKFLRWNAERRIGMVCKKAGNETAVLTCFSAVLPGLTAAETISAMNEPMFLRTLIAVAETCPAMSEEQHVAIAVKLSKSLEDARCNTQVG